MTTVETADSGISSTS